MSANLTAAQVWYVTTVYPESVTDDEVLREYELANPTNADRSFWETAAIILNKLANQGAVTREERPL